METSIGVKQEWYRRYYRTHLKQNDQGCGFYVCYCVELGKIILKYGMSSGRLLERPAEDLNKCSRNCKILGIVRVQFKETVSQPTREKQLRRVEEILRWQLQNARRLKVSESTEIFEGSPKRAYEIFEKFEKVYGHLSNSMTSLKTLHLFLIKQ